jgi:hypothetical protein
LSSATISNRRVAVLSPVAWRTPPRQYGAWETVASNITEGLVARGWDVTLFASRDSVTSARLHAVVDRGMDLGSCREVIKDGQTGFLVNNVNEAAHALERLSEIDRSACRQRVQQRFSIKTMVEAYEQVYLKISSWELDQQFSTIVIELSANGKK